MQVTWHLRGAAPPFLCTGQVGPTGRSVDSGAAEQARLRVRYLGSCCAFRASWAQASVHAPAPWSRKSCLPVSTSQAPVNPPPPQAPTSPIQAYPSCSHCLCLLAPCLPLPRESRTPALLGTSGAESENSLFADPAIQNMENQADNGPREVPHSMVRAGQPAGQLHSGGVCLPSSSTLLGPCTNASAMSGPPGSKLRPGDTGRGVDRSMALKGAQRDLLGVVCLQWTWAGTGVGVPVQPTCQCGPT